MATKLKKMQLTSIDLVRAGANQEADICLFKSADPPETQPTDKEVGIFKRFLKWIRENADDPIEKEAPADNAGVAQYYTDCIAKSLDSIHGDTTIDDVQKAKLIQQSLEQYNAAMNDLIAKMYDEEDPTPEPEEDAEPVGKSDTFGEFDVIEEIW